MLTINASKTKVMKIGRRPEEVVMTVGGTLIEQVKDFKYLGVYFAQGAEPGRAVQERLRLGREAMGRLSKV